MSRKPHVSFASSSPSMDPDAPIKDVDGTVGELTETDLQDIEAAVSKVDIQGAHYPKSSQQMVDR